MRRHQHMMSVDEGHSAARVSRAIRWHSVRLHHEDVWDWCAHHEEVRGRVHERRRVRMVRPARTRAVAHA